MEVTIYTNFIWDLSTTCFPETLITFIFLIFCYIPWAKWSLGKYPSSYIQLIHFEQINYNLFINLHQTFIPAPFIIQQRIQIQPPELDLPETSKYCHWKQYLQGIIRLLMYWALKTLILCINLLLQTDWFAKCFLAQSQWFKKCE